MKSLTKIALLLAALLSVAPLPHLAHALPAKFTTAQGDAPAATVAQNDANLARLEAYLLDKVNVERDKAGLDKLTLDVTLADVARGHSADMRDNDYFAHESPTPALHTPLDRYKAVFHETPLVLAENVYRSWGVQRTVSVADIDVAHDALMHSPGHRANILRARAQRIGIGIVANARGDFWITEEFSRIVE